MQKKILIVDDNRMILKYLSNLLKNEGHIVETSEDGLSALSILTSFSPDIVFVDLIFPNIGGEKLCQIIRTMEHMKHCYLVILSAAIAEMELDYTKIGVNACIAKGPFGQMGKHVLDAIKNSEAPKTVEGDKILGVKAAAGVPVYARRMTKELLSRNQHLETILESMAQGILEIYSGKIVYANSAAISLFNTPLEALLSSRPQDFFHKSIQPVIETMLNIKPGKSSSLGRIKPVQLKGKRVVLNSFRIKGESETAILLITDVTEQKNLELQLQHSRRMDAVGSLAGGMAHNFNNLLMGIQGNVSILIQDKQEGDVAFNELSSIERCVESGANLTRQLLSFAKGGKHNLTSANINEIVQKSSDMFGHTRRDIRIHKSLQEAPWKARLDPGQIELALMDLYVNACHAMPEGGALMLKTENVTLDKAFVEPHETKPGRYLKVSVTDEGIGMNKETMERIFEPFYTTKKIGMGTGLGLASVFGIIKRHLGFITVSSQVGTGSCFAIYLPALKNPAKISEKASPETIKPFGDSRRILIVDDEEYVVNAGRAMLESFGFDVLTALGGKEGVTVFRENKDTLALVILDLIMPDMSGSAVFDLIKTEKPDLKVLISSGLSYKGKVKEVIDRGCDGFLQKPYNLEDLAGGIVKVMGP